MLNLMPFSRREDNLFNYLDNLEKNFFGDMDQNLSPVSYTHLDVYKRQVLKDKNLEYKHE